MLYEVITGQALEEYDARLPEVFAKLGEDDLLLITADHGNDPTYKGTDHTREYVPLLAYSPRFTDGGRELPLRRTFADIGARITSYNVCYTKLLRKYANILVTDQFTAQALLQ